MSDEKIQHSLVNKSIIYKARIWTCQRLDDVIECYIARKCAWEFLQTKRHVAQHHVTAVIYRIEMPIEIIDGVINIYKSMRNTWSRLDNRKRDVLVSI